MTNKPILCIDFDGVIHSYTSGWKGAENIPDPPVPGAIQWLWRATNFFEVHIYSSRSKDEAGLRAMRNWFGFWCQQEFGAEHLLSNPSWSPSTYPIKFADLYALRLDNYLWDAYICHVGG